ncbi:hypothetical protein [Paenibacillus sp. DMB20]|uniref:hypothetical protein n=1 Tax=Paenibacillus sp. DMB20 TaxID=1642570 RepID=UPI001F43371A|nr:hypothetical protein [Paenibacillus sp. DMB20]
MSQTVPAFSSKPLTAEKKEKDIRCQGVCSAIPFRSACNAAVSAALASDLLVEDE